MLSLLPPAFWCWNSIESKLWQYLEEADNVYPSSSIYFLRASEIISLAVFIVSYEVTMYFYSERIKKISVKEIMLE